MLTCAELNPTDLDALLALYAELHPTDPVLDDRVAQAVFTEIMSSPHFFLLGGKLNDDLVASCYLNIVPNLTRNGAPYAVIENVITLPSKQNQGMGKELMKFALEFAWEMGCYKAMLMTGSNNPGVHQFYRNCGFDPEAKTAYVAYPERPSPPEAEH